MTSCRPTGPGVSRPGAVSLAGRVRFATAVLALALFTSAVRAEVTPEAAAVVARYLHASGCRAAFRLGRGLMGTQAGGQMAEEEFPFLDT